MLGKIAAFFGKHKDVKEQFKSQTVLIVDDNETDLTLIKRTVERIGHRAITAANGIDGFALAKAQRPALILSDCRMPEMDGVEMCRRLKKDEDTKDIPIVFLTNVDTPKTVIECFDMGVNNYICKPIKPKLLMSQIELIFNECLAP